MPSLTVTWPAETNEHGRPMLWFGSWLRGHEGEEGQWFYSGRGAEQGRYAVPGWATGLRIRKWPNEGLDAEYSDIFPIESMAEVQPASLDFERPARIFDQEFAFS